LAKKAKTDGISSDFNNDIENMKVDIRKDNIAGLSKIKAYILFELQKEISLQAHLKRGSIQNSLKNDPDILKSIEVLSSNNGYQKILKP
jgi:hypothetical protein